MKLSVRSIGWYVLQNVYQSSYRCIKLASDHFEISADARVAPYRVFRDPLLFLGLAMVEVTQARL